MVIVVISLVWYDLNLSYPIANSLAGMNSLNQDCFMNNNISKRTFLASAIVTVGALFASELLQAEEYEAEILSTKIISRQPQFYHGWPTLAKQKSG